MASPLKANRKRKKIKKAMSESDDSYTDFEQHLMQCENVETDAQQQPENDEPRYLNITIQIKAPISPPKTKEFVDSFMERLHSASKSYFDDTDDIQVPRPIKVENFDDLFTTDKANRSDDGIFIPRPIKVENFDDLFTTSKSNRSDDGIFIPRPIKVENFDDRFDQNSQKALPRLPNNSELPSSTNAAIENDQIVINKSPIRSEKIKILRNEVLVSGNYNFSSENDVIDRRFIELDDAIRQEINSIHNFMVFTASDTAASEIDFPVRKKCKRKKKKCELITEKKEFVRGGICVSSANKWRDVESAENTGGTEFLTVFELPGHKDTSADYGKKKTKENSIENESSTNKNQSTDIPEVKNLEHQMSAEDELLGEKDNSGDSGRKKKNKQKRNDDSLKNEISTDKNQSLDIMVAKKSENKMPDEDKVPESLTRKSTTADSGRKEENKTKRKDDSIENESCTKKNQSVDILANKNSEDQMPAEDELLGENNTSVESGRKKKNKPKRNDDSLETESSTDKNESLDIVVAKKSNNKMPDEDKVLESLTRKDTSADSGSKEENKKKTNEDSTENESFTNKNQSVDIPEVKKSANQKPDDKLLKEKDTSIESGRRKKKKPKRNDNSLENESSSDKNQNLDIFVTKKTKNQIPDEDEVVELLTQKDTSVDSGRKDKTKKKTKEESMEDESCVNKNQSADILASENTEHQMPVEDKLLGEKDTMIDSGRRKKRKPKRNDDSLNNESSTDKNQSPDILIPKKSENQMPNEDSMETESYIVKNQNVDIAEAKKLENRTPNKDELLGDKDQNKKKTKENSIENESSTNKNQSLDIPEVKNVEHQMSAEDELLGEKDTSVDSGRKKKMKQKRNDDSIKNEISTDKNQTLDILVAKKSEDQKPAEDEVFELLTQKDTSADSGRKEKNKNKTKEDLMENERATNKNQRVDIPAAKNSKHQMQTEDELSGGKDTSVDSGRKKKNKRKRNDDSLKDDSSTDHNQSLNILIPKKTENLEEDEALELLTQKDTSTDSGRKAENKKKAKEDSMARESRTDKNHSADIVEAEKFGNQMPDEVLLTQKATSTDSVRKENNELTTKDDPMENERSIAKNQSFDILTTKTPENHISVEDKMLELFTRKDVPRQDLFELLGQRKKQINPTMKPPPKENIKKNLETKETKKLSTKKSKNEDSKRTNGKILFNNTQEMVEDVISSLNTNIDKKSELVAKPPVGDAQNGKDEDINIAKLVAVNEGNAKPKTPDTTTQGAKPKKPRAPRTKPTKKTIDNMRQTTLDEVMHIPESLKKFFYGERKVEPPTIRKVETILEAKSSEHPISAEEELLGEKDTSVDSGKPKKKKLKRFDDSLKNDSSTEKIQSLDILVAKKSKNLMLDEDEVLELSTQKDTSGDSGKKGKNKKKTKEASMENESCTNKNQSEAFLAAKHSEHQIPVEDEPLREKDTSVDSGRKKKKKPKSNDSLKNERSTENIQSLDILVAKKSENLMPDKDEVLELSSQKDTSADSGKKEKNKKKTKEASMENETRTNKIPAAKNSEHHMPLEDDFLKEKDTSVDSRLRKVETPTIQKIETKTKPIKRNGKRKLDTSAVDMDLSKIANDKTIDRFLESLGVADQACDDVLIKPPEKYKKIRRTPAKGRSAQKRNHLEDTESHFSDATSTMSISDLFDYSDREISPASKRKKRKSETTLEHIVQTPPRIRRYSRGERSITDYLIETPKRVPNGKSIDEDILKSQSEFFDDFDISSSINSSVATSSKINQSKDDDADVSLKKENSKRHPEEIQGNNEDTKDAGVPEASPDQEKNGSSRVANAFDLLKQARTKGKLKGEKAEVEKISNDNQKKKRKPRKMIIVDSEDDDDAISTIRPAGSKTTKKNGAHPVIPLDNSTVADAPGVKQPKKKRKTPTKKVRETTNGFLTKDEPLPNNSLHADDADTSLKIEANSSSDYSLRTSRLRASDFEDLDHQSPKSEVLGLHHEFNISDDKSLMPKPAKRLKEAKRKLRDRKRSAARPKKAKLMMKDEMHDDDGSREELVLNFLERNALLGRSTEDTADDDGDDSDGHDGRMANAERSYDSSDSEVGDLSDEVTDKFALVVRNIRKKMARVRKQYKKLSKLSIKEPDWDVPPGHMIDSPMAVLNNRAYTVPCEDFDVKVRKGQFLAWEDRLIRDNFRRFCELHDLEVDAKPFLTNTYEKKQLLKQFERHKFVQYLARGLHDRRLYSVFKRFQALMRKTNSGKFTAEEDAVILTYCKKFPDDSIRFWTLSHILNRPAKALYRRLVVLQTEKRKKLKLSVKYKKFIRRLLRITKAGTVGELKDTIKEKHWLAMSEKYHGFPCWKLKQFWLEWLYPRLYSTKPIDREEILREIVIKLYDDNETDQRAVDWTKFAEQFENCTPAFLTSMFRNIIQLRVPAEERRSFRSVIEYLRPIVEDKAFRGPFVYPVSYP